MKKPSKTTLAAIGIGLFLTWGGNYGISSVIADINYQMKRDMYYESMDWTKAKEYYERRERLEKNIDFWRRNAKFPLANQLGLFQKEDKVMPTTFEKHEDKKEEAGIRAEYGKYTYMVTFKDKEKGIDVEFYHYEVGLERRDVLTLNTEKRSLMDIACDGRVEELIVWYAEKNTIRTLHKYADGKINPSLTEEELKMFPKADKTLEYWKKEMNIKDIQKIWERQRT